MGFLYLETKVLVNLNTQKSPLKIKGPEPP